MSRYVDKKLTIILMTNLALCRAERLTHTVAGLIDSDLAPYRSPSGCRSAQN